MLVAVIARDFPGKLQLRLDTRAAHLAYIERTGVVRMAGPLLENGEMCGSLIVLDVPDMAAAHDWVAGDPYGKAGLFETVTATEWRKVIG
jgi:hypothetical protein